MNKYTSTSTAPFTSAIYLQDDNQNVFPTRSSRPSMLFWGMQNLVLAVAAITAPQVSLYETPNPSQSVSTRIVWGIPRKGRRISLREARQIALRILEETERELWEERSAEAKFLLGTWEERHIES
ncbi:MAG: hypothetical protein JST85_17050 [Acidobacteria bacterium]|nr:hypothetical protein [Acidobacteriota bacterium]